MCIEKGENVWTIIIDIYPVNDDGALIDASGIGAIAALRDAVLPGLDENGKPDYKNRTKDKLPLTEVTPLSFTFYKLGKSLILDPTREEEEACDTKINWGISKWNGKYMLNSCQKGQETPYTSEEISQMMEVLPKKHEEVMKKLNKFLK